MFSITNYLSVQFNCGCYSWAGNSVEGGLENECEEKQVRVYNFLHVPIELEKLILFGYFICLSTFLNTFVIVPLRFLSFVIYDTLYLRFFLGGLHRLAVLFACRERRRYLKFIHQKQSQVSQFRTEKVVKDASILAIILISTYAIRYIDMSRLYHTIRGQSTIKLYVIFNVCEVGDKLLSSFGMDISNSYFFSITRNSRSKTKDKEKMRLRPLSYFVLYVVYTVLHSVVSLYQISALNVAINSHNNALLTLLISNQFVEIKSAVFKKFEKGNLFQLSCSEIIERFQIFIFCLLIGVRNVFEMRFEGYGSREYLESAFFKIVVPLFITFCSEVIVDWLKHSFITKFNGISPKVYAMFVQVFCKDYLEDFDNAKIENIDIIHIVPFRSPHIANKIGFSHIPMCCITIQILLCELTTIEFDSVACAMVAVAFVCTFILKIVIDLSLSYFVAGSAGDTTTLEPSVSSNKNTRATNLCGQKRPPPANTYETSYSIRAGGGFPHKR